MTGWGTNTIPASVDSSRNISRKRIDDIIADQIQAIPGSALALDSSRRLSAVRVFSDCNLYTSQVELRQNTDARLVSIGEVRATEISDFLTERRQAAARLAASEDISNYFSNLDLGMSVKYGLFANLAAIERRFQATMDEEKYQGQPAYLRLAFFDRNGVVQVDVGGSSAAT